MTKLKPVADFYKRSTIVNYVATIVIFDYVGWCNLVLE